MGRRKRRVPRKSKVDVYNNWKNCKIYDSSQIFEGQVDLVCNNVKSIGNQSDSFNSLVASVGNCRITNAPTKSTLSGKVSSYNGKNGKILLTNLEGLKYRSSKGMIPKKDYEKKSINLEKGIVDRFDCGCITEEREFIKSKKNKYIPTLRLEEDRGRNIFYKDDYIVNTIVFPTQWVTKYLEVDDKIFENKKRWMTREEYQNNFATLNRNERRLFKKTDNVALGCFQPKEGKYFSTKNALENLNGDAFPLTYHNGDLQWKGENISFDELTQKNIVCQFRENVPSIINDPKNNIKKGEILPLERAKKIHEGFAFHYAFPSYYNPNDLQKSFVRQGFQCRGGKGGKISNVKMTINSVN